MLPITTIIYVFLEEKVTKILLEAIYVNNHCTLGYPPTKHEPQFLLKKSNKFFVGDNLHRQTFKNRNLTLLVKNLTFTSF
jgi:hypothetical protein